MIEFLNSIIPLWNVVPIWKILIAGLPVAYGVYFLFSQKKLQKYGHLSPVLWVVLTVVVLFFWSAKAGKGAGEGDSPVDNPTQDETQTETPSEPDGTEEMPQEGTEATGGEVQGASSGAAAKPISLEISFNKATKTYTIKDITSGNITETSDLRSELESMEQSGYIFTQIDTYNLTNDQNNGLKDGYKDCKVNTHN